MGVASGLDDSTVNLGLHAIREAVKRNHIRSLGKHSHAIHDELETLAPLIRHAPQFDRAQPRFHLDLRSHLLSQADGYGKEVAILLSVSCGIPQLRIGDHNRERKMIHARSYLY